MDQLRRQALWRCTIAGWIFFLSIYTLITIPKKIRKISPAVCAPIVSYNSYDYGRDIQLVNKEITSLDASYWFHRQSFDRHKEAFDKQRQEILDFAWDVNDYHDRLVGEMTNALSHKASHNHHHHPDDVLDVSRENCPHRKKVCPLEKKKTKE